MKVLKISCPLDLDSRPDSNKCHNDLKAINPGLTSILHNPNNHVLIFDIDYDVNGHVKATGISKTEINKMDESFKTVFNQIQTKEFV